MPGRNRTASILLGFLWLLAISSLLVRLLGINQLIPDFDSATASFISDYSLPQIDSYLLPVALLIAALNWITANRTNIALPDSILILSIVIVVSFFLYVLSIRISEIPRLVIPETPQMVGDSLQFAWSAFSVGIVFVLLFWRQSYQGDWVWATLYGFVGGALLAILLAYPIFTLLLHYFVPGFAFSGIIHWFLIILAMVAALVIVVSIGPFSVWRSKVNSRRDKLVVGIIAGCAAGFILFGLLGGTVAGLLANTSLFGVAITRAGYSEEEWVLKFAFSINRLFPINIFGFWLLLFGAGMIGGVTASLFKSQPQSVKRTQPVSIWPAGLMIITFPALILLALVNAAIFTLLSGQLLEIFVERNNAIPLWHPDWTVPLLTFQPLVLAIFAFCLGIIWLSRLSRYAQMRGTGGCLGQIIGWLAVGMGVFLYLVNPSTWRYLTLLVLLGLLMVAVATRLLWKKKGGDSSPLTISQRLPTRLSWIVACAAGGLIAAIFYFVTSGIILSAIQIDITMLGQLNEVAAPPPGLDWLADIFRGLVIAQSGMFLAMVATGVLFGIFIGWFISIWAPRER